MSALIFQGQELIHEESLKYGKLFLNGIIASRYGVATSTLRSHLNLNQDELIEGIHWIKEHSKTSGGHQKVIKWTLEGVHMLGFFIKSEQAKLFRKFTAKLLTEIKNGNAVVVPTHIDGKNIKKIICGYKSEVARNYKKIRELESKLKQNLLENKIGKYTADEKLQLHIEELEEELREYNETNYGFAIQQNAILTKKVKELRSALNRGKLQPLMQEIERLQTQRNESDERYYELREVVIRASVGFKAIDDLKIALSA